MRLILAGFITTCLFIFGAWAVKTVQAQNYPHLEQSSRPFETTQEK